ncbi:hypothetical protein EJB05_03565, partial [Eragrostis curvula]
MRPGYGRSLSAGGSGGYVAGLVEVAGRGPPAAASFAVNSLAPFVSRSAGGDGFLLERYEAVTSRGGLVLLERREINRRRRSERRSDMCVYDPMTNARVFFPFPPDINRNPLYFSCVYTYVVLTAADGIGCAFTVVAADMSGLLDCSGDISVQTISSSSDAAGGHCGWSPIKLVRIHGAPPWSTPVDVGNAAVVVGGVIHWLMRVCEHILTYDVKTGRAGKIELPEDRRQFENWNASGPKLKLSPDGKLTLLFMSEFRVYVWEMLPNGGWKRKATIDTEAGVRSQLAGEVELVQSGKLGLMNFGDQRSGAVLLKYYHFFKRGAKYRSELLPLVLDMETEEIRLIKAAGITYEVDLASRLSAMKAFSSTPTSSSFVPVE